MKRAFGLALLMGVVGPIAAAETPIERGAYLVDSIGACANCHGRDGEGNLHPGLALSGGFHFNKVDPDLPGQVYGSNITPDPGTGIGKWTQAQIVEALRNGKRPDGTTIGPPMPVSVYRNLSDQDAAAIAAYVLSTQPVKNSVQRSQYRISLKAIEPPITHVDAPSETDQVAYGGYLVTFGHCVLCHTPKGENAPVNMKLAFAGDRDFGSIGTIEPSVSRNISSDPDQGLGNWTDQQIKDAITKGVRPDGTKLAGPMPYSMYAKMKATDLDAIVAFVRTIKPVKVQ